MGIFIFFGAIACFVFVYFKFLYSKINPYITWGGIVGLILLFSAFSFAWISAIEEKLRLDKMTFENFQSCSLCEQNEDSLFSCGMKNVCSGANPLECFREFDRQSEELLEINEQSLKAAGLSDSEIIQQKEKIIRNRKIEYTARICGFKSPEYHYEENSLVLSTEPKIKYTPNFFSVFVQDYTLSRGIDIFFALAYFPPLLIVVVLLPIEGAFIGWIISKMIRRKIYQFPLIKCSPVQ